MPETDTPSKQLLDDLRSTTATSTSKETAEESVLGDKAVGGIDDDADHLPNVVAGLKAAINNDKTTAKGKKEAKGKLDAIT